MIGPPRKEDMERKIGEGLLLAYTHPNFSWEEIRRHRQITKRGVDPRKNKPIKRTISRRLIKYGPLRKTTTSTRPPTATLSLESLSSLHPSEFYEEIEYVDDEEETEEREESVNQFLPKLKDGETKRRQVTTPPSTTVSFPTLITEGILSSASDSETPMIVFDKSEKHRHENQASPSQMLDDGLTNDDVVATTTTRKFDASFSLPPATNEQVAFLLTNGGSLSDYKWIGLYDQCKNISIPLVSLADADPPREENIGPFISQERDMSSGVIRILNCNTILVPDFHFEISQKLPNSFFFVGTGNVSHVHQQTKARTIGQELGDPLESYSGGDVMVRLPRGLRTFDVDFMSIYNEDKKKTLGYINLPSLLVPPCVDDL
ncbi:hypothetical protein RB195_025035 [Necator americanus]